MFGFSDGIYGTQAHIKMEAYGFAIADASKAIELDPGYVKAYYRRALSLMAIVKNKEALKDFRTVCRKGLRTIPLELEKEEADDRFDRVAFI